MSKDQDKQALIEDQARKTADRRLAMHRYDASEWRDKATL